MVSTRAFLQLLELVSILYRFILHLIQPVSVLDMTHESLASAVVVSSSSAHSGFSFGRMYVALPAPCG